MWWRKAPLQRTLARPLRLAVILAAGGLTAGCWQPLYRSSTVPGGEGVQDKFASVEVTPIPAPTGLKGSPFERVAVGMFNALQFDLHNGQTVFAPAYKLTASVNTTQFTSYLDPTTGRPDSSIEWITVSYQLIELTTGKMVVNDIAYAHVSYDNPGSQQRFAGQRARRDAEDRAVVVAADAIRNRLASYFVAGT
jgi:LPS-assembly lipoprotein